MGIEIGTGAAMALLGFVVKALVDHVRRQHNVISNHMQHSTEAIGKLSGAIDRLTDLIERKVGD